MRLSSTESEILWIILNTYLKGCIQTQRHPRRFWKNNISKNIPFFFVYYILRYCEKKTLEFLIVEAKVFFFHISNTCISIGSIIKNLLFLYKHWTNPGEEWVITWAIFAFGGWFTFNLMYLCVFFNPQ